MKDFLLNIEPTTYLLIIVYVIAILFISWKQGWIIFVLHKKTVVGKVVSVDWYGPTVSYVVANKTYKLKIKRREEIGLKEEVKAYNPDPVFKIGQAVKIAYNSTNPEKAKLCPGPVAYVAIPTFLILGIFVIFKYCL